MAAHIPGISITNQPEWPNSKITSLRKAIFYVCIANSVLSIHRIRPCPINPEWSSFKPQQIVNELHRHIENSTSSPTDIIAKINEIEKSLHFDDSQFEWFEGSTRATNFVYGTIRKGMHLGLTPMSKNNLFPLTKNQNYQLIEIYHKIFSDTSAINDHGKLNFHYNSLYILINAKKNWIQSNKLFNGFKWLKENDLETCEWAYKYTLSQNGQYEINCQEIPTPSPESSTEHYYAVLMAIDCIKNIDSKTLFLKKIKQAYAQRKIRKDPNKVPFNIFINLETKNEIDAIKKNRGLTNEQLIAHVINKEYIATIEKNKTRR